MSPCVEGNSWFCHVRSRESWNDHFSLRIESCFHVFGVLIDVHRAFRSSCKVRLKEFPGPAWSLVHPTATFCLRILATLCCDRSFRQQLFQASLSCTESPIAHHIWLFRRAVGIHRHPSFVEQESSSVSTTICLSLSLPTFLYFLLALGLSFFRLFVSLSYSLSLSLYHNFDGDLQSCHNSPTHIKHLVWCWKTRAVQRTVAQCCTHIVVNHDSLTSRWQFWVGFPSVCLSHSVCSHSHCLAVLFLSSACQSCCLLSLVSRFHHRTL